MKKVRITQIRSGIGRPQDQKDTLKSLKLRKMHHSVEVKEIASAIREQLGVSIDKKSIEIPEIKKPGTYHFKVNIATGIVAAMAVEAD